MSPGPQVLMCLTAILGMTVGSSFAQPPASPMPQNPSPMVDTTRPHPRIEKQEVPGQRLPLSIGTLYLSPRFRVRRRVPLIVHFHGSPWLLEYHIFHALPGVALITVQLGAGSGIYSRTFSEPARFELLLSEALDQIKKTSGRDVQWGGIALTSFSAGYGAIRAILQQTGNYDRASAILLADSLHTSYIPEGKPGNLDPAPLEIFARFAEGAAKRDKFMWVTHSEVYPGTFASTTETTDYLLDRLHVMRNPV